MDAYQIKELLENLEAWGEEFRATQHGATLTILRAKKTIMDQAARIAQMNKPTIPRCTGCGGMMLSENWTWCANCGHHRQREDLTPETDAQCENNGIGLPLKTVSADFARKLERERNALKIAGVEIIETARQCLPRQHPTIERNAKLFIPENADVLAP